MRTIQPKQTNIKRDWHLIDANGKILGRTATEIVKYLMGKHKKDYTPHVDMGDHVVVINCEKIKVTGKKAEQKLYYSHSGYPGGFKQVTYRKMSEEHPERIIELAVKRMLPENRLRDNRMVRLKVLVGERNPYKAKFETNKQSLKNI